MDQYAKTERKLLRDLAGEVYEWELHGYLEELDEAFDQWRNGEMLSSELSDKIHTFHQHAARELWSMYQTLKEDEIVARGVVLGALSEADLSSELRKKLKPLLETFRRK